MSKGKLDGVTGAILLAVELGITSGLVALAARRAPILGWLALSPLGLALSSCGGWAALAGAVTGAILHGSVTLTQPARLRPLGFVFGAMGWGLATGILGILIERLRPSPFLSEGALLIGALVLVPYLSTLPMRRAGAPRWIHAALACTQEPWPVVIRTGWYGGDATVTGLLSLSASIPCLLGPGPTFAPWLVALPVTIIASALVIAARALARARRAIAKQPRLRVAAVVVNGAPPNGAPVDGLWPLRCPDYRSVVETAARYEAPVARAAREGARLIVLPEVAVLAEGDQVEEWLTTVGRWAKDLDVAIVAPHFDPQIPTNTLTVIEPSGRRLWHDKQHPAPGLEPPPRERQAPGPHRLEQGLTLSTVICVDLDYPDLIPPVRAAGGLLAVPANDWPGFADLHDRTAVWAAVLSETTVLRATGHGLCSVRDGAGRLLAQASSLAGPTVLVVDAPLRRSLSGGG